MPLEVLLFQILAKIVLSREIHVIFLWNYKRVIIVYLLLS